MSMPEFEQLMTHRIDLIKRARNKSGDWINILTISNLPAFVQFGNHFFTTKTDEKKEATAIVFLKDNCGIDINYDYWIINQILPYSRPDMEVLKIDPIDNPITGNTHHFEIEVR
jgi:hypothetical protein